jgi:hypothetical protein
MPTEALRAALSHIECASRISQAAAFPSERRTTQAALTFSPAAAASPFLTLGEAAIYLRFDVCADPARSCRRWLHRHAVPVVRRGRALLIERRVLEAILANERTTKT